MTVLPREQALCDPCSAMHGRIRVQARVGGAWTPPSRVVGPRHTSRNASRVARSSRSSRRWSATVEDLCSWRAASWTPPTRGERAAPGARGV